MKKRKGFLVTMLALTLSFSMVFAATAGPVADVEREVLVDKLTDYTEQFDPGFFKYTAGSMYFQIERFGGSLVEDMADVAGNSLTMDYKLNTLEEKTFFDFLLETAAEPVQGQVFIDGDKLIFSKNIIEMLADIAPATIDTGKLTPEIEFIYLFEQYGFDQLWQDLITYSQGQLPEREQALLEFLIAAVPYEYFTIADGKLTLTLDQAGFEEVIYQLLQKVKNEKECFADIVVNLMAPVFSDPNMPDDLDPEQMRADIIEGIEQAVAAEMFPGRAEISMMAAFIQVKEFIYQVDIIPGGQERFEVAFDLRPASSATGLIEFGGETSGKQDDFKGAYYFKLDITTIDNVQVTADLIANTHYQGPTGATDLVMLAKAQDLNSGEVFLDLKITGEGTDRVEPGLVVATPVLTATNSVNIEDITKEVVLDEGRPIIVNGEVVLSEVPPVIKDGRTLVPVRTVAEALACQVE
ncbi:MAG: copper amine oxidase N-terminal domain-containing protein [Desulfotomaculum sp.]|nr:copper amine oxidase N-terminal domain-containing protein [Desulfotomaculum sp.]